MSCRRVIDFGTARTVRMVGAYCRHVDRAAGALDRSLAAWEEGLLLMQERLGRQAEACRAARASADLCLRALDTGDVEEMVRVRDVLAGEMAGGRRAPPA